MNGDGRIKNRSKAKIIENFVEFKKPGFTKSKIIESSTGTAFLTIKARLAFIQLRKVFTKAEILHHFNSKHHIRIQTNESGYSIRGVLSKLTFIHMTFTNLNPIFSKFEIGQWYWVAFFSRKITPAKSRNKTNNRKLLSIIKTFKTWRHYLEDCKHEIFVHTDHNNLRWFWRAWTFKKFNRLKTSFKTTYKLITTKARLMQLLILCHASLREFRVKKKIFKLRTLKFFIMGSRHWSMPAFQVSKSKSLKPDHRLSNKLFFARATSYPSYANSGRRWKVS